MSVHYKFKSTLHFETITFDGLHISVADLKREIVQQKRLGKIIDFDLQITNAQNKEEYKDDNFLIPKNTTLIISRIPIAHPIKKGWDTSSDNATSNALANKPDNLNMDLFKMQGSEEEKINAMMMQSTADYDPKTYHRIKGQSQVGEVPASYRCNKCKRGGHWIKNCSFTSGKEQFEIKRNTGIPRSFRGKPDISSNQETSKHVFSTEKDQDIPEDLICGICRNIFVDAVMIPCCGSSFCDDCVRTSLLESEDNECPDCKEKNCSPGSLIPNRFLRNSVNVFKNETGYKIGAFKCVSKMSTTNEKNENIAVLDDANQPEELEVGNKSDANKVKEDSNIPSINKNKMNLFKKEKEKFDSDYEDNITIKMPQQLSDTTFTSTDTNKEHASPSYLQKSVGNIVIPRRDLNFEYKSDLDIKQLNCYAKNDSIKPQNERSLLPTPIASHHHKYKNLNVNEQREKSLINTDQTHRIDIYKSTYIQMPRCPSMVHMSPYNNGYNNMSHRPLMSFGHYQNQPVHQISTPYIPSGNININSSQLFQSTNLASIYQGVAAKVGTGLIDDPLEAFNRIMKEKEKQKVDRRRSPGHHRSRSPGRLRHRFKSPVYERDLSREISTKDKRPRSRERKREYSYERRQGRVIRQSSNGSISPSDKKKRYVHRRSRSPKSGYKLDLREKSLTKPYGLKTDTVEPPPPGFESLHIENLTDNDNNRKNRVVDPEVSREVDEQGLIQKRQRAYVKTVDEKIDENSYRSLTPPIKSKISKVSKVDSTKVFESSPKTPDRREKDFEKIEKSQLAQLLYPAHSINAVKSDDRVEPNGNMGKENNIKDNIQLKDRKKKKKIKSERKKNKKDKKVKKDKNRKSYSKSIEPTPEKFDGANINLNSCDENNERQSNIECDLDMLKKNESVLDIDLNRENISFKVNEMNDVQISKWELDDNNLNSNILDYSRKISSNKVQEHSEITSDVIRKAENAIFAKAINAIRPVEFKVVIDSKRNSKDPSISFKCDHRDRSRSPKSNINKSVKERLGNKVVNDQKYASDRSKNNRRANSEKNIDDKFKNKSLSYSSKKSDKERKFEDQRNRKSYDREIENLSHKESTLTETNKHTQPFKDGPTIISTKSESRNYESDRNAYNSLKCGEMRLISSIASRPCRPDNPFRKFDENSSSSSKVLKFNNPLKRDNTPQSTDQTEHKKRKDKKLKKPKSFKRYSSTESVKSEKQKDVKSKKKK